MANLFPPGANTFAKATLVGGAVAALGAVVVYYMLYVSPYVTREGVPAPQPVPFSHAHHAGGLGLDCRYCHRSAEVSAHAGMPDSHTCMTCHAQVWTGAPALAPLRRSFAAGRPLVWTKVYDLPDFVYFNHAAHVNHGVGCATCHGRVDKMVRVYQTSTLYMKWCLDCHENPAPRLRPQSAIYDMAWSPPAGAPAVTAPPRPSLRLLECYTCHR